MDNDSKYLDKDLLWLDNSRNVIDDSDLTIDKTKEMLSNLLDNYKSIFTEKPGKIKRFS